MAFNQRFMSHYKLFLETPEGARAWSMDNTGVILTFKLHTHIHTHKEYPHEEKNNF